jgi:NitT/TauT family transport system ATP-binding protein
MLNVENVTFSYRNSLSILSNISIICNTNEVVSIVGRSGTGKTTLFNLLCGYQRGSHGSILIDNTTPEVAARHCNIGYVFQSPTLIPWLTAYQNIELPLKLNSQSQSSTNIRATVLDVMQLAKIDHAAQLLPSQLSGGMQTRVALARALVYSPSLLLLDEPFSALDDIVKEEIYTDLQSYLAQTKVATVIITHNLEEAIRLSNRIYVLARPHHQAPSTIVHSEIVPFLTPRSMDVTRSADFHKIRARLMGVLR